MLVVAAAFHCRDLFSRYHLFCVRNYVRKWTLIRCRSLESTRRELERWPVRNQMASDSFLDQVRRFQCNNLRKVSTRVTAQDGRQFVESLSSCGAYSSTSVGSTRGYVLDMNADITVAVIAPGLLLGSQDVAIELRILEDCNVTHILNVGYQIPNYYESKFVYKNVDIYDDPDSNIRLFFDGCFEFIDDARQQGCVLVHCNAGVSRAPTIVIAYLMNRNCMRFKEAYEFVKNIRSTIRPNDGFMKALKEYDKELFGA